MATRRPFSREFKVEAVKLVPARGVGVSQAARDLDAGETVLRRGIGMRELAQDPRQAFPDKGVMKPERTATERLRKEVAKLKMERNLLKCVALGVSRSGFSVRTASGTGPIECCGTPKIEERQKVAPECRKAPEP